ncbi:unnamed protein product, partial [Didymodactylos carnosus]
SNYDMEYIHFRKSRIRRLVLVTITIKEVVKVFELLNAIGLHCDIIVNKFYTVLEDKREYMRQ